MTVGPIDIARRYRRSPWPIVALHVVAVLIIAYWSALAFVWPYRAWLPASRIEAAAGHASVIALKRLRPSLPPLAALRADSPADPQASRLQLFENGQPLGPAHAASEAIRQQGGGRYAHRGGELLFSTSDDTDPARNGRRYTVISPMAPEGALDLLAAAGALFLLYRLVRRYLLSTGQATTGTVAELGVLASAALRRFWRRTHRLAVTGLHVAAGLAIAYWIVAEFFPWSYQATLAPERMSSQEGSAFSARLQAPAAPLVTIRSDTPEATMRSLLALAEDGHPLGPAHSQHAAIRDRGAGRYSHWGHTLVFSSSDGSDPRRNGRVYTAAAPIAPTLLLQVMALAAFLWLLPLLMQAGSTSVAAMRRKWPSLPLIRRVEAVSTQTLLHRSAGYATAFAFLVSRGSELASRRLPEALERWLTALASLGVVLLGWAVIHAGWATGQRASGALAWFLPLSDANGYNACGNQVLDLGSFALPHVEWCTRRPIYSSLLASFMALGGRNLHAALLVQAAIVSLTVVMLAREATRLAGVIGAALVLALLFTFAAHDAFAETMSENAGLALGAIALALLLRGAESGGRFLSFAGIALLSLAVNARAGCFFVLPAAALWAGWNARLRQRGMVADILLACVAVALGFGIDFLLIALNGAGLGHAHGNFSQTLYGLAFGGKGWLQIVTDHPELWSLASDEERNHAIYAYALAEIRAHPGLIAHALWTNLLLTWRHGIGLYGGYFGNSKFLIWWLWVIGFATVALRFRDPRCALVGLLSIGGLLSGPFIVQDGGERVFAATIAVDAVQAGIGLAFLCRLVARSGGVPVATIPGSAPRPPRAAVALAAFLVAATLVGYTPLRHAAALPRIASPACPAGDRTVVTQLGRASAALTVTRDAQPQVYPPSVPLPVLLNSEPPNERVTHVLRQETPYSLILAYQQWEDGAGDAGVIFPLLWLGDARPYFGQAVRICFIPDNPYQDDLWGETHRVRSLETITPAAAASAR